MTHTIITVDGPSGTGKSTVARAVARDLGFEFLDTGALFRAAALAIDRQDADCEDDSACAAALLGRDIKLEGGRVWLDGQDVSEAIRTPHISSQASRIAIHPSVRTWLLAIQRDFPESSPVVAEGRDTGSVVFPTADVKLYLDASAEERARRRQRELQLKGSALSFERVLEEINQRDERDRNREVAPLIIPDHAVVVDTTQLTLEKVIEKVLLLIRERLADQ